MTKLARTNFRRTGDVMAFGKVSATTTSCGIYGIPTGLKTPRFAIAMPRCSASGRSMRGVVIYFHSTTGSIAYVIVASASDLGLMEQSMVAFNWVAFE